MPAEPRAFTVAIDGPAAAGKGTIARAIADRFGFAHLDTGLLYRATGLRVLAGEAPVAAAASLDEADFLRPDLRSAEAARVASEVAQMPQVRAALVEFQRRFARRPGGAVLDGRDIGTVVCPQAEVKLFVTAGDTARARRRWLELSAEDPALAEATVLADLRERDRRDADRTASPLRAAADAVLLDTTDLAIDAAVETAATVVMSALEQGRTASRP